MRKAGLAADTAADNIPRHVQAGAAAHEGKGASPALDAHAGRGEARVTVSAGHLAAGAHVNCQSFPGGGSSINVQSFGQGTLWGSNQRTREGVRGRDDHIARKLQHLEALQAQLQMQIESMRKQNTAGASSSLGVLQRTPGNGNAAEMAGDNMARHVQNDVNTSMLPADLKEYECLVGMMHRLDFRDQPHAQPVTIDHSDLGFSASMTDAAQECPRAAVREIAKPGLVFANICLLYTSPSPRD